MSEAPIRSRWYETHRRLSAEAERMRNSQAVAFGLVEAYDALSPDERSIVHGVLREWLVSTDNGLRYDAAFLTSQRRIREMKTAVVDAIAHHERLDGPEAFHDAKNLRRILSELEAA